MQKAWFIESNKDARIHDVYEFKEDKKVLLNNKHLVYLLMIDTWLRNLWRCF